MSLLGAINENGKFKDLGCVGDALKVVTDVNVTDSETVATEQDLTAAYANLGNAIPMKGYKTLGIHVAVDVNASDTGKLKVMGMLSPTDTPFEVDGYSVKTLWSGTGAADFEKYYEFDGGVLPYLQIQGMVDIVNDAAAYLTGGTSAQGTYGTWGAITDGEFAISIDGVDYELTGIDFTGVTDMDDVAGVIQTAIRAATGNEETVVWSTDHFVITSSISTDSSAVGVTSSVTGGTGTDISGAGVADWMDCDTGNGTPTAVVNAADITVTIIKG